MLERVWGIEVDSQTIFFSHQCGSHPLQVVVFE